MDAGAESVVRIALLGTPGAGKGTQSQLLQDRHGVPQISTGDILRRAVRNETDLGRAAREYMDRGDLVPDELIIDIVSEKLESEECLEGFVLDGFPRTVAQAQSLQSLLGDLGKSLDGVIRLRVPDEQVLERLSGRRVCTGCEAMFHLTLNPPESDSACDHCGRELVQRDDDREDTIRERLVVYERESQPLYEHLRSQGLFHEIDGVGTPAEVHGRILDAVEKDG